jgi:uncharacterized membrane protein
MPTGQLVNLPAGAPLRPTGQPFNRSTNRSVICHRFSHPFSDPFISGGRWQPQVAGGGAFPFSPPLSPQRSPPLSLRDQFSHLSSVICHRPSHPFRVAGGSPGWPVAGFSIQPSIQSSTQPSIQSSVIDSVICHRPSHPFQVAGGSPRWPVAGFSIQPSIQSSTQSSIQPSVIDSVICHPSSIQSSTQ